MRQPLGRLEKVELREAWLSEAGEFTPWLAQPENLEILGETLGIALQLEAQEKRVGPFRADILCKDVEADHWVLIENQLERTDHTHLGQLLTYAAGLQAVTIVWVAARFTEEHRATLDWLNKITDESFSFFGLEVELWRIGSSPAAPKFNIISKPNDWSRAVTDAARAIDETELSETRVTQVEYWHALHEMLDRLGGPVRGTRKARPRSFSRYGVGRVNFSLNCVMLRLTNQVRAELYISGDTAKLLLAQLRTQQEAIEQELGPLRWEELPERRDSRVSVLLENADPEDRADWDRQHRWLAERLNAFHRVFAPRIRTLDADDVRSDADAGIGGVGPD